LFQIDLVVSDGDWDVVLTLLKYRARGTDLAVVVGHSDTSASIGRWLLSNRVK